MITTVAHIEYATDAISCVSVSLLTIRWQDGIYLMKTMSTEPRGNHVVNDSSLQSAQRSQWNISGLASIYQVKECGYFQAYGYNLKPLSYSAGDGCRSECAFCADNIQAIAVPNFGQNQ